MILNVKQVIVMRADLGMRKGKMIAQGAHASLKVFLDRAQAHFPIIRCAEDAHAPPKLHIPLLTKEEELWVFGEFTKICVQVSSEEALLGIVAKAKEAGLPVALVIDKGRTEFNGVLTPTCCAIGPAKSEDIDLITGGLVLL